ncbi:MULTISPECIES: helix-turn-helix domain-containing protein [Streptococcus mitis group]|jgi:transcriptional activator, rgg/gadR/mutR family, C-terminal domain|uniref:Transcriptional activator, Rgg/GadR/MutR family, C-terminal domain protein n=1 Tax=Streptococcus mitis TaxID=28037 RepID=A0A081PQH4_STRMT|nr:MULTISPECIES: Rgg/GadR/MutR family transcriptional regulator [Streptococcus]KEQ32947.1 transcriptional activator, Rgg/GadR/MutR family, C-terminal domain protein [Streptococcus mitis]MDB0074339.1 Rgg/GadR/MutR family transcriptional regulator [Streptococcus gwangjuense]
MKSKLGVTLRKVRKGKQISLCSVADEHLSKSQISRFERGESEISCIRLINILDKLHVTLDEFLILHDDDYTNSESFANLVQYIRKQYSSQSIDNIACLLSDTTNYTLDPLEKTMVKSILHTMDSRIIPSDEELLQLTDYLFKVEKWGYYEIIIFGNCARTINYNSYFLLTKELLKNYIYSSLNKTNKRMVTQLAINCLILSIDEEKFSNCSYLISEIKTLLDNEFNFYEQTVFLYATGYYEFKRQLSSGIEKMKQAIQVLDILREDKLKLHYTDHFNKLVNKK